MQIIKVFIFTTIAFYSCKRISSKEIETAQEITTNVNHTEKENEFKIEKENEYKSDKENE